MTRTTHRQLQSEERMRGEIWEAENVSLQDRSWPTAPTRTSLNNPQGVALRT